MKTYKNTGVVVLRNKLSYISSKYIPIARGSDVPSRAVHEAKLGVFLCRAAKRKRDTFFAAISRCSICVKYPCQNDYILLCWGMGGVKQIYYVMTQVIVLELINEY